MRIGSLIHFPLKSYPSISGQATTTGFILRYGGKTVKSRNFQKDEEAKFGLKYNIFFAAVSIISLILFAAPILPNASIPLWFKIWLFLFSQVLLTIPSLSLTALVFLRSNNGKSLLEYHACEHKVAILLDEMLEPTMDNLKKMPRATACCGSFLVSIVGIYPITLLFQIAIDYWFPQKFGSPIFIAEIMLFTIWLIVSPFILQFFFATAEPSQEKLEEALEVAKELCK